MRGILPALICQHIEDLLGGSSIRDLFDLTVGTSTGGILALGIAHPSTITAKQVVSFYEAEGPRIFSFPANAALRKISPKYTPRRLESALTKVLGPDGFELARPNVLLTAYDTKLRRARIFDSSERSSLSMVQVAMATAAAPTYFPPYKIFDDLFIDGGVVANNPSAVGYARAKRRWPNEEVLLLSLGTGVLSKSLPEKSVRKWGELQWARPIIDCFFDGMSQITDSFFHDTHQENYLRVQGGLNEFTEQMDASGPVTVSGMKAIAAQIIDIQGRAIADFVRRLEIAGKPLQLFVKDPPHGGLVQQGALTIRGMIRNYRNEKLYAFTGQPGRYWPSERIVPRGEVWTADLNVGHKADTAQISVAVVDGPLSDYIEYYLSMASRNDWHGIPLADLPNILSITNVKVMR